MSLKTLDELTRLDLERCYVLAYGVSRRVAERLDTELLREELRGKIPDGWGVDDEALYEVGAKWGSVKRRIPTSGNSYSTATLMNRDLLERVKAAVAEVVEGTPGAKRLVFVVRDGKIVEASIAELRPRAEGTADVEIVINGVAYKGWAPALRSLGIATLVNRHPATALAQWYRMRPIGERPAIVISGKVPQQRVKELRNAGITVL